MDGLEPTGRPLFCISQNSMAMTSRWMTTERCGWWRMRLSGGDIEGALYCVTELIDRRRRANVPVPDWMVRIGRRFNQASLSLADMNPTLLNHN